MAWTYRDMPQLGWSHDDGIYLAGAKSLAEGKGYTIPSLPRAPAQTKYPPLYAVLLTPVWWLSPEFPQNLPLATLVAWLTLPPVLLLSLRLYKTFGFPRWSGWVMVAVLAVNPYVTLFGRSLRSEVPFTALLLGSVLAVRQNAMLAGLLAGLAYLTRTAALPMLIAAPLVYAWKRQWRQAAQFLLLMLPFVAGWALWQRAHKVSGNDPYVLYYLDYVWYQFYNVTSANILSVLYYNFDTALTGMAVAVLPFASYPWDRTLAQTLTVGTVLGLYRLAREREDSRVYILFGILYTAMVMAWHVPPNGRFFFPLFPLLLAGFYVQCRQAAELITNAFRTGVQKRAAVVFSTILAAVFAYIVWINLVVHWEISPPTVAAERVLTNEFMACASRLDAQLPRDTAIFSDNDPLVFLQTGRPSMRLVAAPKHFYGVPPERLLTESLRVAEVARSHDMPYYLMHQGFGRHLSSGQGAEYNAAIERDPNLQILFRCGGAAVYQVRPAKFNAMTVSP